MTMGYSDAERFCEDERVYHFLLVQEVERGFGTKEEGRGLVF